MGQNWCVTKSTIDQRVLDHFVSEFGDHGRRSVEFLLTAQALLNVDSPAALPRLAETIAYSLREAMKTIPASQDSGGGGLWKSASRVVTDARRRFETARGIPGEDEGGALEDLLAAIDELDRFHSKEAVHERRLIAIMMDRTGVVPISAGTTPIRKYQDLLTELDSALHGEATMNQCSELWNRCVAILRQLFLPPDLRREELDLMAQVEPVTAEDVAALLPLIAGTNHLRHFLSQISCTSWLEALLETGLLDPPTENAPWPVFAAVERLANEHGPDVAQWLQRLYQQHPRNATQAFYLADAGLNAGPAATGFVLSVLRDHPEAVAILGVRAVEKLEATSVLVEEFADVLLNIHPSNSSRYVDRVITRVVEGVEEGNANHRLQLICWKLRRVAENEGGWSLDHVRASWINR